MAYLGKLVVLLAMGVLPASALAGDPPVMGGTGWRPLTQEEQAWRAAHTVQVEHVEPNDLARQRAQEEQTERGVTRFGSGAPADPLPAAVDNSATVWFPPIRNQGGLGSCVSFSHTYYAFTYLVAQSLNRDVRNNAVNNDKFSPKFPYNLSPGSDFILFEYGAPTWQEWPYDGVDDKSIPQTAAIWRSAQTYRLSRLNQIDSATEADLINLKQALANGHVLNTGTQILQYMFSTLANDPATAADDALAGQQVVIGQHTAGVDHEITIVGYNDDLWTDINGNGTVDNGEKGAFKIANSWGPSWSNSGFVWVAYDAVRNTKLITGGPTPREYVFHSSTWMTLRPTVVPKVMAEFTVNSAYRDRAYITLALGDTAATLPSSPRTLAVTAGWVSMWPSFSFDGSHNPVDATMSFDVSDLVTDLQPQRYFLKVQSQAAGTPWIVKDFRLTDSSGATLAGYTGTTPAGGLPQTVDNSTMYAWADYQLPGGDVQPPGATTDLLAYDATANSVAVSWTAPGDNGLGGATVAEYALGYSTSVITAGNFAATSRAPAPTLYAMPGALQELTVPNLVGGQNYWFAMRARDAAGNWSTLSNVAQATTIPTLLITTPTTLPSGAVGATYTTTLSALGGTPPWTWSLPNWPYLEDATGTEVLTTGGTALNLRALNSATPYTFTSGFSFPLPDGPQSSVMVSSRGFLSWPGFMLRVFDCNGSLISDGVGEDVFVTQDADAATFRWIAHPTGVSGADGSVNFQVTLYPDGRFRYSYGAIGGVTVAPIIGIKAGQAVVASVRNGQTTIASGSTSLFAPNDLCLPPGISFAAASAQLQGTPSVAGTWSFMLSLADAGSALTQQTVLRSFSLTVNCAVGFTGPDCDIPVVDCEPNPCQNAGTCALDAGDYLCTCAAGFAGKNCEINIDECAANPCQNGGTCVDGVASYRCECLSGFAGGDCETPVVNCEPNPCQNDGVCAVTNDGYACTCAAGFVGPHCDVNVDDCAENPCLNGGICVDGVATYACDCVPGFIGAECETPVVNCEPDPCQNGGSCAVAAPGFVCTCPAAFTGELCADDVDECAAGSDNCDANAVCANTAGGFSCQCTAGFTGDGVTCIAIADAGEPQGGKLATRLEGGCSCRSDTASQNIWLWALPLLVVFRRRRGR